MNGKSIHQLRAIAEGYGIPDIFSKQQHELEQEIELAQQAQIPEEKYKPLPRSEYDTRLMTKRPADTFTKEQALDVLVNHIERGLNITFPEHDRWHMKVKAKEDTGTMRMPLRVLVDCADRLMR